MSYDDYATIRFERDAGILTVILDNPASATNAIDETSHRELARLLRDLREEREARAIVLTGSKEAFIAGGNVDLLLKMRDIATLDEARYEAKQMMWDLLDIELPLVAAVNGDAVSQGASIALFCDVIFMAEDAVLQDPHVLAGLVAGDGGAVMWPLAVGPALAKRYLLTGDPLTAREALRLGLVTHVSPRDQVLADATAFARRLAAGAPLAVRYTKQAVNRVVKGAMADAFEAGLGHELVTFLSGDMMEALTAMQEGREPRFSGR
jgi:enoyl-CoA hydratase/carnithine racemase